MADEKKYRVRVKVQREGQPGYGAAGIYFANGETENEVTQKQLDELIAADKPEDAQGRPQIRPLTLLSHEEVASTDAKPVDPAKGPEPEIPASGAKPGEGTPVTTFQKGSKSK